MDQEFLDRILKLLLEKFPAPLWVTGPVQDGKSYRWQVGGTRVKPITVVLKTRKPLFKKQIPASIEVFGSSEKRKLKPTLEDLEKYLEETELVMK
jgi:hypothetical protein